jgi:hypothetical protein
MSATYARFRCRNSPADHFPDATKMVPLHPGRTSFPRAATTEEFSVVQFEGGRMIGYETATGLAPANLMA